LIKGDFSFCFAMFTGYNDDDTTRDLALPTDFDPASPMRSWTPSMGDFYSENEDVLRGLAMAAGDFECDRCPDKQAHFFFGAGDVPPALPVDPDFRLECTTVIIEKFSPEQIGNGLLRFLRQEAAASITKVSRIKFSVKAYVHVKGLSCDIKVRLYRQECGFAVEFQRRSGDALAFQSLFRLASGHLNVHEVAFIDAHRPRVMQAPVVGQVESSKRELSCAPLLEMARCSADLCLQAEVAEALADYASDANLSWQLSTPDALEVCENLVGIHHVSVAHPMRRLSAALGNVAQFNFPHFVEAS